MWMQPAIVSTHILLPLFFIGVIAASRLNSVFSLLASVALATTFLALVHRIGGWFLVGTFWPTLLTKPLGCSSPSPTANTTSVKVAAVRCLTTIIRCRHSATPSTSSRLPGQAGARRAWASAS